MALLQGLAQYLANANLGTYDPLGPAGNGPTGTIFVEIMPEQPGVAIALFQHGGPEPDAKLGYDSPSVQVRVRGSQDPRVSQALCQKVYETLHGLETTLPDGTVLVNCIAMASGPTAMGPDHSNRFEHVINFRTEIRNLAGARPGGRQ